MMSIVKQVLITAVAGALVLGLVSLCITPLKEQICHDKWLGTFATEYSMTAGCRIQVDGLWYPEEAVRIRRNP